MMPNIFKNIYNRKLNATTLFSIISASALAFLSLLYMSMDRATTIEINAASRSLNMISYAGINVDLRVPNSVFICRQESNSDNQLSDILDWGKVANLQELAPSLRNAPTDVCYMDKNKGNLEHSDSNFGQVFNVDITDGCRWFIERASFAFAKIMVLPKVDSSCNTFGSIHSLNEMSINFPDFSYLLVDFDQLDLENQTYTIPISRFHLDFIGGGSTTNSVVTSGIAEFRESFIYFESKRRRPVLTHEIKTGDSATITALSNPNQLPPTTAFLSMEPENKSGFKLRTITSGLALNMNVITENTANITHVNVSWLDRAKGDPYFIPIAVLVSIVSSFLSLISSATIINRKE